MGLWDVFDYAVIRKPVTKAYDLGQVAVSKTVDCAVQIPSVTKSVLISSYALGCAAVSKINIIGNDGDGVKQKMKEYLPGPESRDNIVQALTHPATREAFKLLAPGGAAAYNIVESVLQGNKQNQNEQNKYEDVINQLKVLQAENEKLHKQLNKLQVMTTSNNSSTLLEQKPEEVMTKGLKNKDLSDNHRVVPNSTRVLQAENEKLHKQLNKLQAMATSNNSSSSTVLEQKPEEVMTKEGLKNKDLSDNHRVVPNSTRSKI